MEPANSIIQKLGGATRVARILGMNRVSVCKWRRPRSLGGTGGIIPIVRVRPLIEAASAGGIRLVAEDFLPKESVK